MYDAGEMKQLFAELQKNFGMMMISSCRWEELQDIHGDGGGPSISCGESCRALIVRVFNNAERATAEHFWKSISYGESYYK